MFQEPNEHVQIQAQQAAIQETPVLQPSVAARRQVVPPEAVQAAFHAHQAAVVRVTLPVVPFPVQAAAAVLVAVAAAVAAVLAAVQAVAAAVAVQAAVAAADEVDK